MFTGHDRVYIKIWFSKLVPNQNHCSLALQETMTHTTLQKVFSVLNCKARMEKIKGQLSH